MQCLVMFTALLGLQIALTGAAEAWTAKPVPANCLAMAENDRPSRVHRAAWTSAALKADEVQITFNGHATFPIESAAGVRIATDYAGTAGPGVVPHVVTMNQAHITHWTPVPDPAIKHVLHGWNSGGGPATHNLTVGDVRIRNVSTDIRGWSNVRIKDGNSIFIFEVGGLCVGHLGHLHHKLGPERLGLIGRLDVVFVPVDGSFTMDQVSMMEVVKALRTRIIIPMHYFTLQNLERFIAQAGDDYIVQRSPSPTVTVSNTTLPDTPTLLILPGN